MSSTFQIEHNRLFGELREVLKTDIARITGKANGGRSILFVYPPEDDDAYIAYARENFNSDEYSFIDLRTLFTEFVSEQGIEQFQENYKEFGNEVFFSDNFCPCSYRCYLWYGLLQYQYYGTSDCDVSPTSIDCFLSCYCG